MNNQRTTLQSLRRERAGTRRHALHAARQLRRHPARVTAERRLAPRHDRAVRLHRRERTIVPRHGLLFTACWSWELEGFPP